MERLGCYLLAAAIDVRPCGARFEDQGHGSLQGVGCPADVLARRVASGVWYAEDAGVAPLAGRHRIPVVTADANRA